MFVMTNFSIVSAILALVLATKCPISDKLKTTCPSAWSLFMDHIVEPDMRMSKMIKPKIKVAEAFENTANYMKTKDCTKYKPDTRIICDMTKYEQGLITKEATIADVKIALAEWMKQTGNDDALLFLSLNLKTWGLGLKKTEAIVTSMYYEIALAWPRWTSREYVLHFEQVEKPTIVYAMNDISGNDIPTYWSEWYAEDGVKERNLMWVQTGKAGKPVVRKNCDDFVQFSKRNFTRAFSKRKYTNM